MERDSQVESSASGGRCQVLASNGLNSGEVIDLASAKSTATGTGEEGSKRIFKPLRQLGDLNQSGSSRTTVEKPVAVGVNKPEREVINVIDSDSESLTSNQNMGSNDRENMVRRVRSVVSSKRKGLDDVGWDEESLLGDTSSDEGESEYVPTSDSEGGQSDESGGEDHESLFQAFAKNRARYIVRLVDLSPNMPRLLVQGRKRLLAEKRQINSTDSLSEIELSSFNLICDLVAGLREELVEMSEKKALHLAREMRAAVRNSHHDDVYRTRTIIIDILAVIDTSIENIKDRLAVKTNRGFKDNKLGEMLCPVDLDWSQDEVRDDIRAGRKKISANQFMRGIYKDCKCDPDDLDSGLLKNEALVQLAKWVLTGPSSACVQLGRNRNRAVRTVAELSGITEMNPRIIAYCACLFRHNISDKEMWSNIDGSFDMQEMYWNIVGIFDGSESANELLRWWDRRIFGSESAGTGKRHPGTLDLLKAQRAAKRARAEPASDST